MLDASTYGQYLISKQRGAKRPPQPATVSQILPQPVTTKDTASCQDNQFYVGSSCMQGWRTTMEDAHTHILSLPEDPDAAFFAIYDGHGGSQISKYSSIHLHKYIVRNEAYMSGRIESGIKRAFLNLDAKMSTLDELIEEHSGCTAITILIKGSKLYCANVGDSRAVGCVKGRAEALSFDHKPYEDKEFKRIAAAGGWVDMNRVNGNLALSRALGDYAFKGNDKLGPEEQIVTAYPDVEVRDLNPDWEFLVMGCDGIWDVVANQDCVDYIRRHIALGDEPEDICEAVMMHCLAPEFHGSGIGCDNMTIIIVALLHGGTYEELQSKCAQPAEFAKLSKSSTTSKSSVNINNVNQDLSEEEFMKVLLGPELEEETEVELMRNESEENDDEAAE